MKMVAVYSLKTMVYLPQIPERCNTEDQNLNVYNNRNLRLHVTWQRI